MGGESRSEAGCSAIVSALEVWRCAPQEDDNPLSLLKPTANPGETVWMENTLNFYSNSLHMSTDFLNAGESEKKNLQT